MCRVLSTNMQISFILSVHKEAITLNGRFGQKSYDNLISSIKTASHTTLPKTDLWPRNCRNWPYKPRKCSAVILTYDLEKMRTCDGEELTAVDGIGGVLAQAWVDYFASAKNNEVLDHLLGSFI